MSLFNPKQPFVVEDRVGSGYIDDLNNKFPDRDGEIEIEVL